VPLTVTPLQGLTFGSVWDLNERRVLRHVRVAGDPQQPALAS
jgi:hypothetical protein